MGSLAVCRFSAPSLRTSPSVLWKIFFALSLKRFRQTAVRLLFGSWHCMMNSYCFRPLLRSTAETGTISSLLPNSKDKWQAPDGSICDTGLLMFFEFRNSWTSLRRFWASSSERLVSRRITTKRSDMELWFLGSGEILHLWIIFDKTFSNIEVHKFLC